MFVEIMRVSKEASPFGLRSNPILLVHRLDGGNARYAGESLHQRGKIVPIRQGQVHIDMPL